MNKIIAFPTTIATTGTSYTLAQVQNLVNISKFAADATPGFTLGVVGQNYRQTSAQPLTVSKYTFK